MRHFRHWFSATWAEFRSQLTPVNVIGALLCVILVAFVYIAWDSFDTQRELAAAQERIESLSKSAAQESEENTRALCALRAERVHDVEEQEAFLEDHPEQIIRLGDVVISRSRIVDDLNDARETVRATDHLTCKE